MCTVSLHGEICQITCAAHVIHLLKTWRLLTLNTPFVRSFGFCNNFKPQFAQTIMNVWYFVRWSTLLYKTMSIHYLLYVMNSSAKSMKYIKINGNNFKRMRGYSSCLDSDTLVMFTSFTQRHAFESFFNSICI